MIKRCFAFGCSFTHWYYWPTWADFIGVNSESYFNFGNPGLSNKMILHRFIETDALLNFSEYDLVLIGLTAIGRHNWLEVRDNDTVWFCHGGPENWPDNKIANFIRNNLWKHQWGIYDTWLTVRHIRQLLDLKGVNYHIIFAMDNQHFFDKRLFNLNTLETNMLQDIFNLVNNNQSLQDFAKPYPAVKDDNHPNIDAHFDYVKKYFPSYITEKSLHLKKVSSTTFMNELYTDRTLVEQQHANHQTYMNKICTNLAGNVNLYGKYV